MDQGRIKPATARLRKQARHSKSASTRTIPAEGSSEHCKNAKTFEFLHLDHADPCRALRGQIRNRKNLELLYLDHADPRRGSRTQIRNRKKNSSFCTSTTPIPSEGSSAHRTNAKNNTLSFCTSTTPIPAEGRAGTARITKNLEFLHLDHADPRRGSQSRSTIKVLPRRPTSLNLTYIAANAEALCTWLYLHLALFALGSMHLALCTALCTWLQCTWLYVFDSAQVTPCKLVRELHAEEPFAMLSENR